MSLSGCWGNGDNINFKGFLPAAGVLVEQLLQFEIHTMKPKS